jgi:hypothetical protein
MAYERLSDKKVLGTNLDSFVQSSLALVTRARATQNAEEETKFFSAVLNGNLTLEDQLSWRQDQLKRVAQVDKDERVRIRKEISSIKDLIEQRNYTDDYTSKLTSVNSGMESVDSMMSWLKDMKMRTTDPNILSTINGNIADVAKKKYDAQQAALTHQAEFAQNSTSGDVIQGAIDNISSARAKALVAGLDDTVALYDLQLQALNKTKTENDVSSAVLDLSVGTLTGQSSLALLNKFNEKLDSADATTPVTIGGQKYENAKQFWSVQRNNYLSDRTANGFFGRYQSELQDQVDYKQSSKSLSNSTMTETQNWYDTIKDRPELADYATKIQQDAQRALQYTADKRATQIVNDYAIQEDPKKALGDLAYIQDKFGVDQTINYQKIVSSAANQRQDQVQQILSTMGQILKDNPGMSQAEAMNTAIKSGAGASFAPIDLATSTAAETITKAGEKASQQQFSDTAGINATDTKPFVAPPSLREGQLVKSKNDTTVYKYENGALRPFQGSYTPQEFKDVSGKTFADVQTVETLKGVPTGAAIVKADRLTQPTVVPDTVAQTQNMGAYIPDPGLLKFYTPDQITTVGTKKYLKSGVNPVWDKPLSKTEITTYKPEQIIKTDTGSYLKKTP